MAYPLTEENDPILRPFLGACAEEEDAILGALLETARPLIASILRRKAVLFHTHSDLADDLSSLVMMRLLEQLRKCKASYEEGDDAFVIRHFMALCQTITTNAVNEHLRLKYPRRASLQNQLLYVIREAKDSGSLPLFALWRDLEERLCGLRLWEGRRFVMSSGHRALEEDPQRAMHQALPHEDARQIPLHRLLQAMLAWLGGPASFDAVVEATARWRGIEDRADASLSPTSEEETTPFEPVAPDLSPEERLVLNEYLRHLWEDISQLPPKQCAALLLNLCDAQGRGVLGFFPVLGIASFAEIAHALQMEGHELAALWPRLPLEDRDIAQIYDCSVPIIAVWRSRARARLKKNQEEL